jgi:hypothetical protein
VIGVIIIGVILYTRESQNSANIETGNAASIHNQTKAYAEQIIADCKNNIHCPVLVLGNITKTESRQVVLGTFSDLVSLYDESNYPCHETAHHLGMWLYGYTSNLEESLSYADHLCDGGVFHGVFQNYFAAEHLHNLDPNQISITHLCSESLKGINLIDGWNCIHGIGHGLTELYDYNTTAAVDRCNQFEPEWVQITCSKGVFMENEDHYVKTRTGDFDKNNIYYPCDRTIQKYAPECYHYHAQYLLSKNNFNVTASFDQCDEISPVQLAKYCYHGIGRGLSAISYRNVEQGIADCYLGKQSSYYTNCLEGMVRSILKLRSDMDAGFQFCSASKADFKVKCYEIVGQWIKMLSPNEQQWQIQCSKAIDAEYVSTCMNADPDTWKSQA